MDIEIARSPTRKWVVEVGLNQRVQVENLLSDGMEVPFAMFFRPAGSPSDLNC
jgi:hypothetical protein